MQSPSAGGHCVSVHDVCGGVGSIGIIGGSGLEDPDVLQVGACLMYVYRVPEKSNYKKWVLQLLRKI